MGLVDLDEAREDAVSGASRVVRDEEGEHRIESVHKVNDSAEGVMEPRNWSSIGWIKLDGGYTIRYTLTVPFEVDGKPRGESAMRLFWAGFLMTGLLLMGANAFERRAARGRSGEAPLVAVSEDGTGFPQPYPTPKTR